MQRYFIAAGLAFLVISCQTSKQITTTPPAQEPATTITEKKIPEPKTLRESNTRLSDILHTELRVSFDWDKKYLYGEATLTIKPYFYPQDKLFLNARGMTINSLSLMSGGNKKALTYTYENDSLKISLDRVYKQDETYKIFIDYVSKPDELKELGGSAAIASDKGLYFINPDGKDKNKPRQVWTQGETQANSVWFPTIDSPNERFTQEIYITVDTSFVTLSNGLLLSSIVNKKEGTRTDYWKQTLPHAPYLAMMAISNFKIVKDKWRNIEVSYYVDPDYEKYARAIFGNTPEMLEFFSKTLGVDYPWEKYAQVVVRDYVSGAMENTSATLHGEFLQRDTRALLDRTNEDVISHELFHQWFGDLVTCESWSNIPLNESFATYGEYLWDENKYGREQADYGLMQDLDRYLQQAKNRDANLIRFEYESQEDVFDGISYQKGGRILHMLRKLTGDEAFFKSLQLYLTTNKFKPVEAHNLRLAFEEVTGRDLNWFFNQWFFNKGYPELEISYLWNEEEKKQSVTIEQKQDFEKSQLFKIPMAIDVYVGGKTDRKEVVCQKAKETFVFDCVSKPQLVNVDAEKMLVCTKNDKKTNAEWIFQFRSAPLFLDRYEAIQKLSKNYKAGSPEANAVWSALDDKMWAMRVLAIKNIKELAKNENTSSDVMSKLKELAAGDPKATVREAAYSALAKHFDDPSLLSFYEQGINDSAYDVMGKALENLAAKDSAKGLAIAFKLEQENNKRINSVLFGVYADYGSDQNNRFMLGVLERISGGSRYQPMLTYAKFLSRCGISTIRTGIPVLAETARNAQPWYVRLSGTQALSEISKTCEKRSEGSSSEAVEFKKLKEEIDLEIKNIKEKETDKNLLRIYGTDAASEK